MVNAYKEEFGDKLHLGGITSIICVLKGEQVWGTTTTLQHPKFHTPSSSPSEPLSFVDTSSPSQVLTLTDGMLLRLFADLISKRCLLSLNMRARDMNSILFGQCMNE
ncbi:hypothetical protein E5676_scaffold609G001190 [Cucumis melo var. makuwa]|uniref:Uncharacterized protein n=1 Tax=Cucumis melo var. makuwa TaxID=1194695 RepID=A0A5D3DDR8_CUCMM|nr:hypothetical protein E5676_scaffold609G001190 [Cucumis melo var. makuwa]